MLTRILFIIVIVIFIIKLVSGIKQWNKNNNSPKLIVDATVVSKRSSVSHHHYHNNHHNMTTSTSYFITFQFISGDRMEFKVSSYEYGMLIEGDRGNLTFQGTRYLGFERL